MKCFKIITIVLLTTLIASCIGDENEYEPQSYSIGTIHRNIFDDVYFVPDTVMGDSELTLYITNKSVFENVEDGYRLLMYFTKDLERDEKTWDVTYVGYEPIINDKIYDFILTETSDTLGVDPVTINWDWMYLSHDYLTMYFTISKSNSAAHYVYFRKDENKQKENTVVLNFHHDAKGDVYGNTQGYIISIPILELRDPSKDYINIEVVSEVKDKEPISKTFKYKYSGGFEPEE